MIQNTSKIKGRTIECVKKIATDFIAECFRCEISPLAR
jgi:hypothetical protein